MLAGAFGAGAQRDAEVPAAGRAKADREAAPEPAANAGTDRRRPRKGVTRAAEAAMYRPARSFVDHLPWAEALADGTIGLEDGRSVGAAWEIGPRGTEGRGGAWLAEVRNGLHDVLQDSFEELDTSPWVVQDVHLARAGPLGRGGGVLGLRGGARGRRDVHGGLHGDPGRALPWDREARRAFCRPALPDTLGGGAAAHGGHRPPLEPRRGRRRRGGAGARGGRQAHGGAGRPRREAAAVDGVRVPRLADALVQTPGRTSPRTTPRRSRASSWTGSSPTGTRSRTRSSTRTPARTRPTAPGSSTARRCAC